MTFKIDIKEDMANLVLNNNIKAEELLFNVKNIRHKLKTHNIKQLKIDIQALTKYDDYLIATIKHLEKIINRESITLKFIGETEQFTDLYKKFNSISCAIKSTEVIKTNFIISLGTFYLSTINSIKTQLIYLGDIFISIGMIFLKPNTLRFNETVTLMKKVGIDAIPIIGLISFLMGLIMAFMSSIQLKQFGANIYVASLVGLAMARELGPIMTSIIVAGRTGSAFAAEIGTMKISEEIDALTVMGFNITKFLVLPRIVATVIVVPILTVFSNVFANIGGLLVGVFILNLTASSYIHQLNTTLSVNHVMHGILKSILFAFLVAEIGCFRGLTVKKGTEDVGRATTSAVVSGIFLIILADSFIAVLLTYI